MPPAEEDDTGPQSHGHKNLTSKASTPEGVSNIYENIRWI